MGTKMIPEGLQCNFINTNTAMLRTHSNTQKEKTTHSPSSPFGSNSTKTTCFQSNKVQIKREKQFDAHGLRLRECRVPLPVESSFGDSTGKALVWTEVL